MAPRASIIIPAYNHAPHLPLALESALTQTVPCEVIVVNDGSTDETAELLQTYRNRVTVLTQAHRGPAAARNEGLALANGEYVMFLDGDDSIEPEKIERQLACKAPWVTCDILVEDEVKRLNELASVRYEYRTLNLNGDVEPLLRERNLFPIHAPLVRRHVLQDIWFDDPRFPEDWYFWHEVSKRVPCTYLPEMLGTYYKRKTGRSRLKWKPRPVTNTIVRPLRLNLGCGNPKNSSWHPLPGFLNLDPYIDGWRFQDGLPEFPDGSVAGITISHALMFVPQQDWPAVLAECYRVLRVGGILRITEDATDIPGGPAHGGWRGSEPAVTLTTWARTGAALEQAGFVWLNRANQHDTYYVDDSLCQSWYGGEPYCFFTEGIK